ncbi:MAG: acyl transferase [Flavobacteriaceae bacterium]
MDTNQIFEISSTEEFNSLALKIFRFQYKNTAVYREFCDYLGVSSKSVSKLEEIPFLPIELFKYKEIKARYSVTEICFKSSGTTGGTPSKHYVADLGLYRTSFRKTFSKFYGNIGDYCVLALLPSYLERKDSSLVYMVHDLIGQSNHASSGFYLDDYTKLAGTLEKLDRQGTPVILIGVTFALVELASQFKLNLHNTTVIETGGMKGRRKEMIRAELHRYLQDAWGISEVHSEYGMTELLSQAYSSNSGIFHCPKWMRILIRDTEDPMSLLGADSTGGINIIDLANIYSCSFLATQDLGKLSKGGGFEVLGRFDHSDIRGCNLMIM